MKIFDCFTFYNELDLLELRLQELYNHVDYFVLVEATRTFQNQNKDLYFEQNKLRYSKYLDKIIHVIVDDMPCYTDTWQNERFQREAIRRGLSSAMPNDIIIVGDVDEIVRNTTIHKLTSSKATLWPFRIPYFNFYFNYLSINHHETYCVWNMAARFDAINSIEDLRLLRLKLNSMNLPYQYANQQLEIIEHAGWHFSYLGNKDFIVKKLQSFAHAELNKQEIFDAIDIDNMIQQGRGFNPLDTKSFMPVIIDSYYTENLRDKKWQQYHMPAQNYITNFLPQE